MTTMKKNTYNIFIIIISLLLFLASFFLIKNIYATSSSTNVNLNVVAEPVIIYDIVIDQITENSAKVYFKTDRDAIGYIFYGTSIYYESMREESAFGTIHYFYLNGLMPLTTYHFKLKAVDHYGYSGTTGDMTFQTIAGPYIPTPPYTPTPVPTPTTPPPTPTPSPTPTPTFTPIPPYYPPTPPVTPLNWWEKLSKDVAESDWGQAMHWPMNIAALLISLLAMLLPLIMNLPMLSLWDKLYSWFLSIFGWAKKRKQWGIVYDAESGQPIPMAAVRIFNKENKLLKTELTDDDGRYGFEVKAGEYYLDVIKRNFFYPSKITKDGYHKETIKVKDDSIIYADIPIDPDVKKLIHGMSILNQIITAINWMRIPILIVGTFLAMVFYTYSPIMLNFVILIVYIILWSIELINMFKPKGYGVIYESVGKQPISLSIVRVYNEKDGKLVSTKVADLKGHYFYLIRAGEYKVKATKDNYEQSEISGLVYKQGGVLSRDFFLKKLQSSNIQSQKEEPKTETPPAPPAVSDEPIEPAEPSAPAPETPKPKKSKKTKNLDISKKKKIKKYNELKNIK